MRESLDNLVGPMKQTQEKIKGAYERAQEKYGCLNVYFELRVVQCYVSISYSMR